MHIVSHRGSSLSSTRHPIHACAPVRCVVVVLFTRLLFLFVPLLFFRPFQMSSSEFHEKLKSKDLRDFRLGTVATSDHETPLTESGRHVDVKRSSRTESPLEHPRHPSCVLPRTSGRKHLRSHAMRCLYAETTTRLAEHTGGRLPVAESRRCGLCTDFHPGSSRICWTRDLLGTST